MHEMNCHLQRINRNIVECKDTFDAGFVEGWNRINRNIVECKDGIGQAIGSVTYSINRNIVECKERCNTINRKG